MAVQRKVELLLKTVDNEETSQTISYINSTISATNLKTYLLKRTALSTDTYKDAYVIDRESLNEATADD